MIPKRFWQKVYKSDSPNGCWLWGGTIKGTGIDAYGLFWFNGRLIPAHRMVGFSKFGIEACEGKCVCHTCDNPSCVNPDHLWLGTHFENKQDSIAKNRHCFGEKIGTSKLTEEQVLEIKRRYVPGLNRWSRGNARELASEFNVSVENVRCIGRGATWKHLN